MSALAAIPTEVSDTARLGIGGNNPPAEAAPDAWGALKVHFDDLLTEAHNWADGTTVENQAQADEAARLIDELQKAARLAEEQRVAEKSPLDKKIAKIQAKYGHYIADPKTKNPGRVWKAIDALKATVKPYLDKLREEQEAEAKRKRDAAEEAAKAAAEAARAAAPSDLGAQETADDLIRTAQVANAEAKRAENAKAQARGGSRAMGLRTVWRAHLTDRRAALLHYLATRPDDVVNLLQRLADEDARAGKRTIPGFEVRSETVL